MDTYPTEHGAVGISVRKLLYWHRFTPNFDRCSVLPESASRLSGIFQDRSLCSIRSRIMLRHFRDDCWALPLAGALRAGHPRCEIWVNRLPTIKDIEPPHVDVVDDIVVADHADLQTLVALPRTFDL